MTDRELDALVATHVMGMWQEPWLGEPDHWWQKHRFDETSKMHASVNLLGVWTSHPNSLPKFSTTLDAAWLVVEEMRRRGKHYIITGGPTRPDGCCFFDGPDDKASSVDFQRSSLPRAICLAALAALGVEVTA